MSFRSNDATPTALEPSRIEPHVRRVAIVVILGLIMSVLDTTIVNVALHDLSGDLHASLESIQWVITGYLLSLAAVIPITGSGPGARRPRAGGAVRASARGGSSIRSST